MGEPPIGKPLPAITGACRPPRPRLPLAGLPRPLPRIRIGLHSSAMLLRVLLVVVTCLYDVTVDAYMLLRVGEAKMRKRGRINFHIVRGVYILCYVGM